MNRLISIIFILILLASCGGNSTSISEHSADLQTLDALVRDNSDKFSHAKAAADSLSNVAASLAGTPGEPEAYLKAAEAYTEIDLHRALDHSLRAARNVRDFASGTDVADRIRMKLASLYNSQGYMTKETAEIFESLDPTHMPDSTLEKYYVLGVQLYNTLARRSIDEALARSYASRASAYRDSVLSIAPDRTAIAANRYLAMKNPKAAENIILKKLSGLHDDSPEAASLHYALAQACLAENKSEEAEKYLTLTAISDLKRGSRNYRALPQLAMLLLEKGDTERAYRYISRSAADAAESHASKRQMEMASSISRIDSAYTHDRHRHNMRITVITLIIVCAAIGALIAFLLVRRKNRQLNESALALVRSNESLLKANESMTVLNGRLAEESRVKQQYITSFMELCLSYLRKMESFRADLGKIAAKGNLSAVTKAINSSRYVNQEISEFFENFDKAFLSLYPGFIDTLNGLLREEERYPSSDRFSTELRIYALVWLGIGESGEIARFLRCSESTVYNYRTQMRNRAIDRESFEAEIAALSSLEKGNTAST